MSSHWRVRRPLLGVLLAAVFGLSACAGAPFQEISDARQALLAADETRAPQQVPANYEQAQKLLGDATRDLYAGNYDEARSAALAARNAAIQARLVAVAITGAQVEIDAAKLDGQPWEEADQLVQRAREKAESGDIDAAIELAHAAQRLAGGTSTDPP